MQKVKNEQKTTERPDTGVPDGSLPRQKIFQRNKQRYAIKLEDAFWDQLEDCARVQGVKTADLILDEIEHADAGQNRTALLRLYCLNWLRDRLNRTNELPGSPNLQAILSACPSPCVILTREKAIVAYNSAFATSIVAKLESAPHEPHKDGPLTFRLDTPLEEIHADLLSGKSRYSNARAAFIRNNKSIPTGARFCLLEQGKGENSSLICFLVPV